MSEWSIVGKPALIVLHMQHAICDPEGRIAHVGHARAAHESGIIPNQQKLLKVFREKKLPVIYVSAVTDPVKAKAAPVLAVMPACVVSEAVTVQVPTVLLVRLNGPVTYKTHPSHVTKPYNSNAVLCW